MNELSRTEKWLKKAFELAYFIHGEVETAKHIAFNAMNKLEVASNAQYKRFYYSPAARKSRSKVSMNDLQLLQRLVFVESEAFEKEKEFTETATERDLLIYFIKHLIRITLKRNSFYVTLGLSRILHSYGTNEAMEIYNVVVQDPEKVHDDYYYRSRKGVLMKELKSRFGEKLEIANLNRGEQRFQASGSSQFETDLVKKCLQSFTPWNTACDFPEKFNPNFETIASLCFNGKNADDEHRVELNRMHVVLNPETFQRVVNSLSFPLPEEKLEIPRFIMKNRNDNPNNDDNWKNPPSLQDHELKEMQVLLEQEAARRKAATCGYLRVVVDGEEQAFFDSSQKNFQQFKVDKETAELIEVYAVENGRDTLLATYLIGGDDEFEKSAIILENGQKISFSFGDTTCQVGFEETRIRRRLRSWWQRTTALWNDNAKILSPALATFGLLLAFFAGFIVYQNSTSETSPMAEQNTKFENEIPTVWPPPEATNIAHEAAETSNKSVTSSAGLKPSESKNRPSPPTEKDPLWKSAKNKTDSIKLKKNEPKVSEPSKSIKLAESAEVAENVEVKKFPIVEKREDVAIESSATRSINAISKSLKEIKYIFVEVSGDDKYGRQLGEQLMDKFNANKRFLAVNNREKAEGLLKVSVRREHDNGKDENTIVSAIIRLVNTDGFVIFPNKKRVSGWKYVGNATKIPGQIVKDLASQK